MVLKLIIRSSALPRLSNTKMIQHLELLKLDETLNCDVNTWTDIRKGLNSDLDILSSPQEQQKEN